MKIAVTADVHLSDRASFPERYNALEGIFKTLQAQNTGVLIIAGDLFHKNFVNYSEFENLCRAYPGIDIHIIPGNHDARISSKSITSGNVTIYTEPEIVLFGSLSCLFVPYKEKTTMYQQASGWLEQLYGKEWVLVGHGDYYDGLKEINPMEPGTYMPLSRENVTAMAPLRVLLGHIHKPTELNRAYYCGSPCGLDINETGRRRFLMLDTADAGVSSVDVAADVYYFTETFVVVPSEKELEYLGSEIENRILGWGLAPEEKPKVKVRVQVRGYAMDRSGVLKTVEAGFAGFTFYDAEGPLIGELNVSADAQLAEIARRTMQLIDEENWNLTDGEPDKELVKLAALRTIYGS